jgi:hypothetical protein
MAGNKERLAAVFCLLIPGATVSRREVEGHNEDVYNEWSWGLLCVRWLHHMLVW